MSEDKRYFIGLCIIYALLLTLGQWDNLTPQGQWRAEAAPWLGEPPSGLHAERVRAGEDRMYPVTVYSLPADEELRRRIIDIFQLEKTGTNAAGEEKYGNRHVLPDYTADTRPVLTGLSVCISPWLVVSPDGSMQFCANDANVEQGEYPVTSLVAHPFPQYLPRGSWELMYRPLALAGLCFLFPALFCCVGWLWVQRRSVNAAETKRICLHIPVLVGFLGAFADFYGNGFDFPYSLFSSVFSAITNCVAALMLVGGTTLVRKLFGITN